MSPGETRDARDELPRPGSDPAQIQDRFTLAVELTRARERIGKSIRQVAREVDQPVATIGGYFSGQHLPPLRQSSQFRQLLASVGIVADNEVQGWMDALARVRRMPGPRPASTPTPYRGLASFGVEDAEWFFGRDPLAGTVVAKLDEVVTDPGANAMVIVVGPSGSGKSSLLQAGVIPRLAKGKVPELASSWAWALMTPGDRPVRELANRLASACGVATEDIESEILRGQFKSLHQMSASGLVLVIDQFEDLLGPGVEPEERVAFLLTLDQLTNCAPDRRHKLAVLAGLRADYYGRAAREPVLVPALEKHQVIVEAMSRDQLRQAIVGPAHHAGYQVDIELVDRLISDVVPQRISSGLHDAGALPLLSHALLETFHLARRGHMTVADYLRTGGIAGAVSQTGERVFAQMGPDEQALAKRVFLRLVAVDEDGTLTRRRVAQSDLPMGAKKTPSTTGTQIHKAIGALENVIDRFVDARLLTADAKTVEVSHEALLWAWPRLSEWLDADRAGHRLRRQISEAAASWGESDRDPSGLLRGARLDAARAWASADDHMEELNSAELAFLRVSYDAECQQRLMERRQTRRLQTLVAVALATAFIAAVLAGIAVEARNAAVRSRDMALSRQIAIETARLRTSDPALAAQLALAGYRIAPTSEALSALLDSSAVLTPTRLLGQPGATALAVSHDGHTIAVSRAIDGSVQLYSLGPGREEAKRGVLEAPVSGTSPFAVAFSPQGTVVAVGGTDEAVWLWNVSDSSHPRRIAGPLRGFAGAVQSIAFSPDGRMMAAAGTASGVLRWDVETPSHPVPLSSLTPTASTTQSVAFSPNGSLVAAGGSDGSVGLWSLTSPQPTLLAELAGARTESIRSRSARTDGFSPPVTVIRRSSCTP